MTTIDATRAADASAVSLCPVAAARRYAALLAQGVSAEAVAETVGKNRTTIVNLVRLLDLPPAILEAVAAGDLSVGHARAILMFSGEAARVKALALIRVGGLSVRAVESLAARERGATAKGTASEGGDRLTTLGQKLGVTFQKKGRGVATKLEITADDPAAIERVLALLEC